MLARIADQKADCEMVSDTFVLKLPACLLEAHVCVCVPLFMMDRVTWRLLTSRSYIDVMSAHLWLYGNKADRLHYLVGSQPCVQLPCRSSTCSLLSVASCACLPHEQALD